MPFITPDQQKDSYDVIVVGSGAGGGQTAYTLTMDGARVLMLEAGRNYDPVSETPMFQTTDQAPLRGDGHAGQAVRLLRRHGRRRLGGARRAVHADAHRRRRRAVQLVARAHARRPHQSLGPHLAAQRPVRFQAAHAATASASTGRSRYEDIAPYYDKVEMLDRRLRRERRPGEHAGFARRVPAAAAEAARQRTARRSSARSKLGIPVIPVHRAVLTQQLDCEDIAGANLHPGNPTAQQILAEAMQRRAACFWATPCGRGCSIRANYQSTTVHLPPALATGNLDIVTNAMVREVTLGKDGKATGVAYIDKTTGEASARRRRASSCSRPAPASRCASC